MAKILHFPDPEPPSKRCFNKNYTVVSCVLAFALIFSFVMCAPVFGQTSEQPVQLRVPNVNDPSEGWVFVGPGTITRNVMKSEGHRAFGSIFIFQYKNYVNSRLEMTVAIFSWVNKDGSEEEFGMLYSSGELGKFAIKVDGKWYPAVGFYNQDPNALRTEDVVIKNGLPASVTIKLQTVEGPKMRVIILDK